jgi:hypothetical protein
MAVTAPSRPRTPLALRLLSVPVVAVVVIAGVWFTGGQITNDFSVAMWLTAGWMALAGLVCLAVAFKRRDLAIPVVAAYVVTAGALGLYLSRSIFFDKTVNEDVATAAPAPSQPQGSGGGGAAPSRPRNMLLGRGGFQSVRHSASGEASAIRLARGGTVVTLTGFAVDNGPDLRVYLVRGPARDESQVKDFEDLGALKGNKGNQQYTVPRGVDAGPGSTVVVWCRAFSVLFARAPLRG